MSKEFNSFIDTLDAFGTSLEIGIEEVYKEICEQLVKTVPPRTPKDTGETRNSWQATLNEVPTDQYKTTAPIEDALTVVANLTLADQFYYTNNSEAAPILEYGLFQPPDPGPSKDPREERWGRILVEGGYSTQAPRGMLEITIQEIVAAYGA